jgi:ATP-dependent helicase/nuclease subunit A
VLTNRVLRLLVAGTPPERILALTYTKAAAAEMSKRVFQRLGAWTTAPDRALAAELSPLLGRAPAGEERSHARRLLARTIETPGGLKVETIHAFCERLLKRFPLEAGVAPNFTILDEQQRQRLIAEALDEMLAIATADKLGPLWSALKAAIAYAVDGNFERLLADAFTLLGGLAEEFDAEDLAACGRRLRAHLGVRPDATEAGLASELAGVLSEAAMRELVAALRLGGKTDQDRAQDLLSALAATSSGGRAAALENVFLTQAKTMRARLVTRELGRPDLALDLAAAQARFVALYREQLGLTVAEATLALQRLSTDTLARYRAGKARLAVLDFDDLIGKAATLLKSSAAVEWVLFKLDGGLDHILVDEAQDTSPLQWQVIRALAAEFFSGDGAREAARTLFAVGDEKQSIYGFQGAAPTMFAEAGKAFAAAAEGAGRTWRQITLTLSFRSVEPLLAAVDQIFAAPTRTPGVGGPDKPIVHLARRFGHAGVLEIWPTEKAAPAEAAPAFAPLLDANAPHPVTRLAARIADTIKGWLNGGERLASEDRAVRPGDILILVRKRMPFAPRHGLRPQGPAHSCRRGGSPHLDGADRRRRPDRAGRRHAPARGRPGTRGALEISPVRPHRCGSDRPRVRPAGEPMAGTDAARQRRRALATGGRSSVGLAGLGAASLAICFLRERARSRRRTRAYARALGQRGRRPARRILEPGFGLRGSRGPLLQGFLVALRQARPEIKRDMEQGRDEVRVMTVHGAKGLEAPIVFLPDTCSTRSGRWPGSLLAVGAAEAAIMPVFLWPVRGTSTQAAVEAARQAERQADRCELDRLMYVALTRARDRLYVAGFEGTREAPADCWYHLIRQGVAESLVEHRLGDGRSVWRLESAQTVAPDKAARGPGPRVADVAAPAWLARPAPPAEAAALPLRPSQLLPLEAAGARREPAEARARELPVMGPHALLEEGRFLRGTLTHALFEHLPEVPPGERPAAAAALLASRAPELPASLRAQIIAETLAVLTHPELSALFGPGSRAEVPIVATLRRAPGGLPCA